MIFMVRKLVRGQMARRMETLWANWASTIQACRSHISDWKVILSALKTGEEMTSRLEEVIDTWSALPAVGETVIMIVFGTFNCSFFEIMYFSTLPTVSCARSLVRSIVGATGIK